MLFGKCYKDLPFILLLFFHFFIVPRSVKDLYSESRNIQSQIVHLSSAKFGFAMVSMFGCVSIFSCSFSFL